MGTVSNLNPAQDTEVFCGFLYGVERGLAYLPTLDPNTGAWEKYYFKWPEQRKDIVAHVQEYQATRSVYISPALFSVEDSHKENVRGSNVVWADFDGNAPTDQFLKDKNVPRPSLRVQSSVSGHQHLYWHLEKFSTDISAIEGINRALAYALGADPGGWDINQVLRPPGSFNHKRDAPTVIKSASEERFPQDSFSLVPVPQVKFDRTAYSALKIPNPINAMHTVTWLPSELAVIHMRELKNGARRHKILCKAAYLCAEKGLDNAQIYSIVRWIDSRPNFKKFSERSDAEMCYIRLIDYVRQTVPYKDDTKPVIDSRFKLYGFNTHISSISTLKWIVPGILAHNSFVLLAGQSGSGKTRLGNDWMLHLALGLPFLAWDLPDKQPRKILYVSAEMNEEENNEYFNGYGYSDAVKLILEEQFQTLYVEGGIRFNNANDFEHFTRIVESVNPDGIFLDSASMSLSSNMSDEEAVKESISNIKSMREEMGKFFVTIHHPRKNPPGVKSTGNNPDDLYGTQALINQSTTAINIKRMENPDDPKRLTMDIGITKARLGSGAAAFRAEMGDDFHFYRPTIAALPVSTRVNVKDSNNPNKKRDTF